jgi:predicted DNA-binding transcriptional regulator AlpA
MYPLGYGQRYRDTPIGEVPTSYLNWLLNEAKTSPPAVVRIRVEQELDRRDGGRSRHEQSTADTQRPTPGSRRLISASELAKLLRVSLRSVWNMRDDGRLPPPMQLGPQTLRWDGKEILRLIETGQIGRQGTDAS